MKFSIKLISIFFLIFGFANANESIKYIDINYIVNNSTTGKKLNQIIENKNKKIISELNDLGNELEKKKDKIVNQKNILKKDELDKLVKNYEIEVKKFEEIRKKKEITSTNLALIQKKRLLIY